MPPKSKQLEKTEKAAYERRRRQINSSKDLSEEEKEGANVLNYMKHYNKGGKYHDRRPYDAEKENAAKGLVKMKSLKSMKTGGMVEETAPHMLHKGEMVIPAHMVKHFSKLITK